jgi:FtsH-binding integral membrane protein
MNGKNRREKQVFFAYGFTGASFALFWNEVTGVTGHGSWLQWAFMGVTIIILIEIFGRINDVSPSKASIKAKEGKT